MKHTIITLFVIAAIVYGGGASADDRWMEAASTINGQNIRMHMVILADDALSGREAGTEGYNQSADYIAGLYQGIGLTPLGDGGSYFQSIDFLQTRLIPESAGCVLSKGDANVELTFRDDFVCSAGYGDAVDDVTAPLVFVGHCINAPEYKHDDFAGVDINGKIVVVLSGAPPHFDTDQRAFYSSSSGKRAIATARGAVGMITVRTPVDQKRWAWERALRGIGSPGMRWIDEDGKPFQGYPELRGVAMVSEAGAAKLFEFSGHDLQSIFEKHAAGETSSFDMGVDATLKRHSKQREVSSSNVIGMLEGTDPILANEYVIYTAHLDHIGIRPSDDGDDIHNGAYDNAAGIAAIVEIAKAMARPEHRPRRSVIFAAVTAEEKGLQGSSYFAHNPTVPIDQLVANINIDMPYLAFPLADIEAFGAEHSTLHAAVLEATARVGLSLTPDSMPEQVRFVRSDQFSFVKAGIPALAFKAGSKSSDPSIDGGAMLAEFLKSHYHRPSDDLSLPFSTEGAARFVRAALMLGMIVADQDERPRWNEDDFFGDKFSK